MPASPPGSPLPARVAGAALLLTGFGALTKALGLVRELVVARTFGTGAEYDAFLLGYVLPEALSWMVLFVMLYLFLPAYLRVREGDPREAERFAGAFLLRAGALLLGGSLVLALAARPLVRLLAPDLDPALEGIAVLGLRITGWLVLLRGLEGGFRGLLNSHRRFALPGLTMVIANLGVIVAVLLLASRFGTVSVGIGLTGGLALATVLVAVQALATEPGLRRPRADHPELARILRLLPWFLAVEALGLSLPLVDRLIAVRTLEPGAISALAYANALARIPNDMFAVAVAAVVFPELATHAARADLVEGRRVLGRALRVVTGSLLPVTALLLVLAVPFIRAVYQRGAFDAAATDLTAPALRAFAVGLVLQGWFTVLSPAAYAREQHRRLLGVRLLALAVKIAASLVLVRFLGHAGLALGATAFYGVVALGFVPDLVGSWRGIVPRPAVVLPAAAVAALVAWGIQAGADRWVGTAGWPALLGTGIAFVGGGLVYLLVCRAGNVEEVREMERRLLRRRGA